MNHTTISEESADWKLLSTLLKEDWRLTDLLWDCLKIRHPKELEQRSILILTLTHVQERWKDFDEIELIRKVVLILRTTNYVGNLSVFSAVSSSNRILLAHKISYTHRKIYELLKEECPAEVLISELEASK